MFKRLGFVLIAATAIALPYIASSSPDWWNSLTSSGGESGKDKKEGGPKVEVSVPPGHVAALTAVGPAPAAPVKPRGVEGYSATNLGEVIQFDGSPAWVMARWPRVTAALAELDLQGYRVPLVSGTAEDDIAGSLTYYFDKNQRIARITFHGTTGNPRKLVALLTSRYNFELQQAPDPSWQLYQVKWNGKALSELKIQPARVVRADQPFARYEVDLAMKRP